MLYFLTLGFAIVYVFFFFYRRMKIILYIYKVQFEIFHFVIWL